MKFTLTIDWNQIIEKGLAIVAIILLALLVNWTFQRLLRKLRNRLQEEAGPEVGSRAATLLGIAASAIKYVIIFFAGMMVLDKAGINPAPLLAGAGIAGLAIGFGAQSLVKDVVSGFFILFEGQYAVGDRAEINGKVGVIQEVGLRITRLRDPSGLIHFFPNGAVHTVNVFPPDGAVYIASIPVLPEQTEKAQGVLPEIFAEFNEEFQAIAIGPDFLGKKQSSSHIAVLQYQLTFFPLRQALALDKISSRLASGLVRAELSLPQGAEISILPAPLENP